MEFPDELIIEQLMNLPMKDMLTYCQSNSQVYRICQNPYLWFQLIRRDYPLIQIILNGRSYKKFYFDIYPINIYFNHNLTGSFKSDPLNLHIDQEIITAATRLTVNPWIAFYQDNKENIIGHQTANGIDIWNYNLEDLKSVRNIWIYDSSYNNLNTNVNHTTINEIINSADVDILNPGPTKAELMIRYPGINNLNRDIDIFIHYLNMDGLFK